MSQLHLQLRYPCCSGWRVVRVTAKLTPLILAARDSSDEANAKPKTMTKPVAQTRAQKSESERHCYELKRRKKVVC